MRKIEAIETASDKRIAHGTTRTPRDALRRILTRDSPAVGRVGSAEAEDRFPRARLTNVVSCKDLRKGYATQRALSRCAKVFAEALPAGTQTDLVASTLFATRGRKAKMALALQVVSSHFLGVLEIQNLLSAQPAFAARLCPHAHSEADALKHPNFPRLFLLDACSLIFPLGPFSSRLRAHSPGSKFLTLLPPERSSEAEMICLFHWGIDGLFVLDERWKSKLPTAILALLSNRIWVPREVLLAFVKQMKMLLDRQLLPGQSLTARESQVLQLLFRRLTNKEIACDLKISERTAKFHVCRVLNKLGLGSRKYLLETLGLKII